MTEQVDVYFDPKDIDKAHIHRANAGCAVYNDDRKQSISLPDDVYNEIEKRLRQPDSFVLLPVDFTPKLREYWKSEGIVFWFMLE